MLTEEQIITIKKAAICDYLRTTPEGFVLVETKSLATPTETAGALKNAAAILSALEVIE